MTDDEIRKAIGMIGKEVFMVENAYEGRPYVKAVRIVSVEFWPSCAYLKTAHEGSFRYDWGYFNTYEEAEENMKRYMSSEKTRWEPIKTCPICGSPAQIAQYARKYQIECNKCGLSTKLTEKLVDAIHLWNGRKEDK